MSIESLLAGKAVLIAAALVVFFVYERLWPAVDSPLLLRLGRATAAAWRRLARNLGLFGLNLLLSPLVVVPITAWADTAIRQIDGLSGDGALHRGQMVERPRQAHQAQAAVGSGSEEDQGDGDRDTGKIIAPDPMQQAVAPRGDKGEAHHREQQQTLEQQNVLAVDQRASGCLAHGGTSRGA
jgi:hypothetical protein